MGLSGDEFGRQPFTSIDVELTLSWHYASSSFGLRVPPALNMDNSDARGDLSNASAATGVITDGSGVTAPPVEPSSAATPTSPPELAR